MTIFRRIALLLCAQAIALAACGTSTAAGAQDLAVTVRQANGEPASFLTVGATAGQRVTAGTLFVRDVGKGPVTVDIAPVRAETAANLGSAYALKNESLRGPAGWIRISARHLELSPGEVAEVEVAADPPAGSPDGEYLAGVSVQARGQGDAAARGGEVAVSSAQRYVVGVEADLGTERHPLLVFDGASVERQPAGVTFLLQMRNPGNVILEDVQGRVEVENDGHRVLSRPIGPGTFVTGTSIDFPVLARRENPAEGTQYRVRALARYEGREARLDQVVTFGHEAAERQGHFGGRGPGNGFPWLWAVVAAVVALAVAAFLLYRRRRVRVLPGWSATVALIDQELARPGAGPLTVVLLGPLPESFELRQNLILALGGRLRVSDVLTEPLPGTVAVVAPNTSGTAAAALVEDAWRLVGFLGGSSAVAPHTAIAPARGEDVLRTALEELRSLTGDPDGAPTR